ncbi:Solute carrier family 25 member 46-A [Taenia crassiceps]|uniref:Solute carrier family 25 member 46-A n=1 Tax=Taenia crassiceps TaxID=6207 RepID=A0ABR4Q6Z2_9CEST
MLQSSFLLLAAVISTSILAEDSARFSNDGATEYKSVEKRPERQIANYVDLIESARKVPAYSPKQYYREPFTWENIASNYETLRNGGQLRQLDSKGNNDERSHSRGSRSILLDNLGHVYHLGHKHQHKGVPTVVYLDEDDERRQILLRCTLTYHPGSGSGDFEMFYYSVKDKDCLPFTYTGTGGNSNRFNTYKECMQTCTTEPTYRLSWVIVTPFYAASMVEFVQSNIASEPTTLVSCFLEGLRRLLPNLSPTVPRMGSVGGKLKAGLRTIPIRTSRLLPVWRLMLPVVALGVGQHIIRSFVSFGVSAYLGRDQEPEQLDVEVAESRNIMDTSSTSQKGIGGNDQTLLTSHRREKMLQAAYSLFTNHLTADFVASLTAEALLYPLETIAVRLCVQGTRTLVDNLDTGDSVIPIITSFDGAFDVLRYSSSSASGFVGLYRGFGALILQYATQFAFLVGMKYAYERVFYYSSPTSTQPPPPPIGRSSLPADYEPTSQHASSFQSTFYPTTSHLSDHQPTTSVWQPNLDSERWRSPDPNLTLANETPSNPTRSSFVFRGYSPGPYDQPL